MVRLIFSPPQQCFEKTVTDQFSLVTGTQPLPPSDRPRMGGNSSWTDRGKFLDYVYPM